MKKFIKLQVLFILMNINCSKGNCNFDKNEVNQKGFIKLNEFLKNSDNVSDLEESINHFSKVLKCHSQDEYAQRYLTLGYIYKQDFVKALEINSMSLKNSQKNISFVIGRAEIFEFVKNKDSSFFYYNKALELALEKETFNNKNIENKITIINLLDKLQKPIIKENKLKEYIKMHPNIEFFKSTQK